MSILYGAQSVAFLLLSCTPCLEFQHKRKTKAQAKKDIAERKILETTQPGVYRHPAPFETNPAWAQEIALGPNLPEKPKMFKKSSQNNIPKGPTWDDVEAEASNVTAKKTCSPGAPCSIAPSSPTLAGQPSIREGSILDPIDDKWNYKKGYQRADESLWGVNIRPGDTLRASGRVLKDAASTAQASINNTLRGMEGLLPKFASDEKAAKEERHPYWAARNPPVNDLHPPIVSSATLHKGGMKWMLQPPPSAKVMAGLARVDSDLCSQFSGPRGRSRSGSRASTILPSPALSRAVTEKVYVERIPLGEEQIEGVWTEVIVQKRESKTTLASTQAPSVMTMAISQTTLATSHATLPMVPASPTKKTVSLPASPIKKTVSFPAFPEPVVLVEKTCRELKRVDADARTSTDNGGFEEVDLIGGPRYETIPRPPSVASSASSIAERRRSRSPFKRFQQHISAKAAERRVSIDSIEDIAPMGLDGVRDWHAKEEEEHKENRMSRAMKRMSNPELKLSLKKTRSALVEKADQDYISPTKEKRFDLEKLNDKIKKKKDEIVEKVKPAVTTPVKEPKEEGSPKIRSVEPPLLRTPLFSHNEVRIRHLVGMKTLKLDLMHIAVVNDKQSRPSLTRMEAALVLDPLQRSTITPMEAALILDPEDRAELTTWEAARIMDPLQRAELTLNEAALLLDQQGRTELTPQEASWIMAPVDTPPPVRPYRTTKNKIRCEGGDDGFKWRYCSSEYSQPSNFGSARSRSTFAAGSPAKNYDSMRVHGAPPGSVRSVESVRSCNSMVQEYRDLCVPPAWMLKQNQPESLVED